jgi:hypothetical protein
VDPKAGRFTAMDSWKGRSSSPVTLNKYLYADEDPANLKDPSGHMSVGTLQAPSVAATLSTAAINTGFNALTRFSVRLLLTVGTAALTGSSVVSNERHKDKARDELRDLVMALALARNKSRTLYHYTDRVAAQQIMATQELKCTPNYRGGLGGGITYPAGAYATDIAPWNPFTTQRILGNLFFGGNQNRDLTWFAAIDGEEFNPVFGSSNQWVRQCVPGEFVPAEVFYIGPSLLDP